MSTSGWIFWATGFVGYAGFVAAFTRARTWTKAQRFLRLTYREPVDIVAPTAEQAEVSAEGGDYRQSAVALSDLEGAAVFSKAVGNLRRKKDISVHPSEEATSSLDNDLVLIGGPRMNHITTRFLDHLKWAYPERGFEFREARVAGRPAEPDDRCMLALDAWRQEFRYDPQPTPTPRAGQLRLGSDKHAEPPRWDLGVIVAWINPFVVHPRRAFLTAGFTAVGTAAVTRYLLDEVLCKRYVQLRRERKVPRVRWREAFHTLVADPVRVATNRGGTRFGTRWWRFRPPPCFVMVVRIEFTGKDDYEVSELKFVPLELPTRHPLEATPPALEGVLEKSAAVDDALEAARDDGDRLTYDVLGGYLARAAAEVGGGDAGDGLRVEICRYLHAHGVRVWRPGERACATAAAGPESNGGGPAEREREPAGRT